MTRKYPLKITHAPAKPRFAVARAATLPPRVDNRARFCLPVYDQGDLGSCTANALCSALQTLLPNPSFQPSRMFLYENELLLDGETIPNDDRGSTMETGQGVLESLGVCSEATWTYDPARHFGTRPPEAAYTEARAHKLLAAEHVDPADFRATLAQGHVLVMGFSVFESFESPEVARTGVVPLPKPGENCLGGHAICVCGYDNATQRYLVRNSWGPHWGQEGYFTVPYAYFENPGLTSAAYVLLKLAP